jgi:hypothetical protein
VVDATIDLARARLARELEDVGIAPVDEAFLDEVVHASRQRGHEGTLPAFGAFVAATGMGTEGIAERVQFESLSRLRQLADGRTSFLERTPTEFALVIRERRISEADLAKLCAERDGHVVRLFPSGVLQVLSGERIWTRVRTRWWRRPTATRCHDTLMVLDARPPGDPEVLAGLLDLAVHTLSPAGIGATLVWLPDWDRTGCAGSLAGGGSTPLLSVTDRALDPALKNLLAQHDGAALISPDGSLWWAGAELIAPPTPPDEPPIVGGTRHRSAARFSHLRPDAWVIVISHDGPVSVFVSGREVIR